MVRKLHGTAARANRASRSGDLHVRGATGMRLRATLFLLRYWHVDLPYNLNRAQLRASSDISTVTAGVQVFFP